MSKSHPFALSYLSRVFGFMGVLLAIPATLVVKGLLQGRQETHFLVVLLSEQNVSEKGIIPEDSSSESNAESIVIHMKTGIYL